MTVWFLASIIFLFGLCVGSFVNVLIHRLPGRQPIGFGRSFCPDCGKTLSWWELIPLFSFFYLGGRCSKCKARISWQYPVVELTTGVVFSLIFLKFITNYRLQITDYRLLNLFFWLFIAFLLITIFAIDLRHYIIPNRLVYTGIVATIFYLLLVELLNLSSFKYFSQMLKVKGQGLNSFLPSYFVLRTSDFGLLTWSVFTSHLAFAIIGAGFFGLLVLITKGKGMGMGDVRLAGLLGLVFGAKVLDVLFLAFVIGGFAGSILILAQKKTLKSKVPFGPFLCGAALLVMFI